MKHDLVVFSVLRNGIQNGYPFVENYSSWLDHCDEIFVLDGHSTDGTDVVLRQLARLCPKLTVVSAPWPANSNGGSAIAAFTNQCLAMVRERGQRLLYIQADEILEEADRRRLANWRDGAVEFSRYVLFWNSFHTVLRLERDDSEARWTAWQATRLFPADTDAVSVGDGLSFELRGATATPLDIEVLHYGWNFPVNILQKHISHASLYPDNWDYRRRASSARRMLARQAFSFGELAALDEQYYTASRPFRGSHPRCMQHLVGRDYYDPYVALSLLEAGARW